ncbi:MAG TPA: archaellin/type IV pilin N-terminal domain-containing protein [Candidatus Nanoarchaeia archaeon]|nr:archaellin/type IV pilin N-terminal domain-containing protein [Candidatus Nanoarchaeia archaeon]
MKKSEKRGISPLIATVLLIGFTIALAAIIFSWISSFTEERASKTAEIVKSEVGCATSIEVGVEKACVDSTGVHFTLENRKNNDISGFVVRLESTTDPNVDVIEVDQRLGALEVTNVDVVPLSLSIPESALIVPKLSINGKVALCQEKAIEVFITQGC